MQKEQFMTNMRVPLQSFRVRELTLVYLEILELACCLLNAHHNPSLCSYWLVAKNRILLH